MSILVNLKQTIKTSTPLIALIAATNSFSMDEKTIEKETASMSDFQEEEIYYPIDEFGIADIEFGFSDESIFPTGGEIFHQMTSFISAETIKSLTTAVPGTRIIGNIHKVYSQPQHTKKKETLSATIGDNVKSQVETLPGGNIMVEVAGFLKAPGQDTFAATLTEIIAPATNTDITGETHEIAGNIAKASVETFIPGGKYITQATGFLGRKIFGTPTLFGGIVKTFMDAPITNEGIGASSDDEDAFFTQSSDSSED